MSDPAVQLVVIWIALAVIMMAGIVALLVWAVRARQFRDQDRAARLPLDSGIPPEDAAPDAGTQERRWPRPCSTLTSSRTSG